MSAIRDSLELPAEPLTGGPYAGKIATSAALVSDKVFVTLDSFEAPYQFGPCMWQPRVQPQTVNVAESPEAAHNITVAQLVLPARGNRCLVVFDENEQPWILVWWPFA